MNIMCKGAVASSVLGATLAVTACGGGGGGGGVAVTPPDLVELSSANAKTVAGAAVSSSMEGADLGAFALSAGPAAGTSSAKSTQPLYSKVDEIQSEQIRSLAKQSESGYMQAAVGPVASQCDAGGSVTLTGNIANEQTLSAGDSVTLEFSGCDDGFAVVDGTFSMTITSFSGDFASGMFTLGVTLDLTAFTVAENGETVSADGDVSMTLDATSSPTLTVTVSSSSLSVAEGGASHSLSDYSMTQTVDTVTGAYSIESDGTVTSSAFDGAATFETVEPFAGSGTAYPGSGELLISGAGGATLRVIALDTTLVRLELDSDGDGTVDEIVDATWDEL